MAGSTPTDVVEETEEPTELSIGMLVAWLVGGLTLLSGVATIVQMLLAAGVVFVIAGLFGLPPTRRMIEDELNVRVSRWLAVLVFLVLVTIGAGLMS